MAKLGGLRKEPGQVRKADPRPGYRTWRPQKVPRGLVQRGALPYCGLRLGRPCTIISALNISFVLENKGDFQPYLSLTCNPFPSHLIVEENVDGVSFWVCKWVPQQGMWGCRVEGGRKEREPAKVSVE